MAWRGIGEVQWWCVREGELGVPFYRRSEAVAENGVLRRWITAVQCLVGKVQRLSVVVDVPWFHLGANRSGIWLLRGSSTDRGGAGPSAAGSALCACRAMATV